MENDVVRQEQLKSLKTLTMVVYALQGLSFVTGGVTGVVGVIINYIKREEVAGTLLESHFRWQIRTFWFALLGYVISGILLIIIIGWFLGIAVSIWLIYRIVKGWLNLNDGRPMYPALEGSAG
ncbi:MAG TPA: hypothetical protein VK043_03495 [Burkholderiales bacterium]|nr:hypothetical protein [Burkholderiales bacterium]